MGLNTSSGANNIYLQVSGGKLVNKKENIEGFSFTGHLLEIKQFMDEYQGKQSSKISLTMKDAGEDHNTIITFYEESWYSVGFFARLGNAAIDFSKPITIGASGSEQNEKITFCWLKQGKTVIEKDATFPKPEKTVRKKGREDVVEYNYNECIQLFEKLINLANDKIQAAQHTDPELSRASNEAKQTANTSVPPLGGGGGKGPDVPDDDLPF